jgi:hypothetical protein
MKLPRLKLSDRITWSILLWIFFNLLWLKFLEAFIPIWIGAILATAAAVLFVIFGPRPAEELDEDEDGDASSTGEGRAN